METTEKLKTVQQIVNTARSCHNAGDLEACEELLSTIPDVLGLTAPAAEPAAMAETEPGPDPAPEPEPETPATPETIGDRINPPEGSTEDGTEG